MAVFIEKSPKAVGCIKENLAFTRLQEQARVIKTDVFQGLRQLEGEKPFDCIFMDPPYGKGLERQVFELLQTSSLMNEKDIGDSRGFSGHRFFIFGRSGNGSVKNAKNTKPMHIFLCVESEKNMSKAVYPGSFDPVTYGHLDVIIRWKQICSMKLLLEFCRILQKVRCFLSKNVLIY